MKTIRNTLLLFTLTLSMALLPACSSDDDPLAPGAETYDGVIDAGGKYLSEPPSQTSELVEEAEDVLPDGTIMPCTTERHSIVDTPLEYATFDPNAEVNFPGNRKNGDHHENSESRSPQAQRSTSAKTL